jgi:CTP synthase
MNKHKKTRIIFVTGGVVSSLGKGITSASIAALLQARGYKVCMRKLDPYLNIDPGTMSPYQHGEVFVTDDGSETDLDLGHYERFTGISAKKTDNLTSGQVYEKLINMERRGDFLGVTVQVIPHVTNIIKEFILHDIFDIDFLICEIGGTVGDIEALPYFEAIRQLGQRSQHDCAYVHLTLVPYLSSAKELKTKPTQHSVKELLSIGIQPDIIICRADRNIPENERNKIALFCNVDKNRVIQGVDQDSIYKAPLEYYKDGLDKELLSIFGVESYNEAYMSQWRQLMHISDNPEKELVIDIIGKYNILEDAYKSLNEAFYHAGLHQNCKVKVNWINAEELNDDNADRLLEHSKAIMVPGGFGSRGIDGKIAAIKYAREKKIPFFGICLGMQLTAIEFARNVVGIKNAHSTEFTDDCDNIIDVATKWIKDGIYEIRTVREPLGGTMRLGSYPCHLIAGSRAKQVYGDEVIYERHRHRFEFNNKYLQQLEEHGMIATGYSADGNLVEMLEYRDHPWFLSVQFHPEFKSRLLSPHPLFMSFVKTALNLK